MRNNINKNHGFYKLFICIWLDYLNFFVILIECFQENVDSMFYVSCGIGIFISFRVNYIAISYIIWLKNNLSSFIMNLTLYYISLYINFFYGNKGLQPKTETKNQCIKLETLATNHYKKIYFL